MSPTPKIGNEYDICTRGFLGESALSIFAKVYTRENVLFWRPVKMYFLGVCVKFWQKKVENRPENAQKWIYLVIYLTAKVYTHKFFSAKRPRKLIPAKVVEATRRRRNFVPGSLSIVRNMCPLGLLSAGAFVRRGFYPLGLLSLGAFIRGDFFDGAFVRAPILWFN